ncbi:MAG TPA: hypothetical protein VK589_24190 [Chryseolinea sp.]|nr:hypothetical protein [Chryseolinea sp.]
MFEKILATVFKAKHWEIFVTLISLSLIESIVETILPVVGMILDVISTTVILGWILVLGYGLARLRKDQGSTRFWVFIGTGIQLIIATTLSKLIITIKELEFTIEGNLPELLILLVYSLMSTAIIFSYPAKTLKLLETKEDIDINDYFGDIIRLLFWPIGIWTIQPRINKIANFKLD